VFLFDGDVVKGPVLDYGSAQGKAGAEASKRRLAGLRFERVARIECAVLRKQERVAVNGVRPGTSDDVDRTSRGSARLC
jgi:hypothetical protein